MTRPLFDVCCACGATPTPSFQVVVRGGHLLTAYSLCADCMTAFKAADLHADDLWPEAPADGARIRTTLGRCLVALALWLERRART